MTRVQIPTRSCLRRHFVDLAGAHGKVFFPGLVVTGRRLRHRESSTNSPCVQSGDRFFWCCAQSVVMLVGFQQCFHQDAVGAIFGGRTQPLELSIVDRRRGHVECSFCGLHGLAMCVDMTSMEVN